MKVRIYLDVFPWSNKPENMWANTVPTEKPDGAKRYAVDVEIPDPAGPDAVVEAEAVRGDVDHD